MWMMYLKKFQKSRLNNIRLLYGDVQQHFTIVIISVGFVMCGRIYDKNYIVINPKALSTELINIITANIGHKYLIIKLNIFFLLKEPSP